MCARASIQGNCSGTLAGSDWTVHSHSQLYYASATMSQFDACSDAALHCNDHLYAYCID